MAGRAIGVASWPFPCPALRPAPPHPALAPGLHPPAPLAPWARPAGRRQMQRRHNTTLNGSGWSLHVDNTCISIVSSSSSVRRGSSHGALVVAGTSAAGSCRGMTTAAVRGGLKRGKLGPAPCPAVSSGMCHAAGSIARRPQLRRLPGRNTEQQQQARGDDGTRQPHPSNEEKEEERGEAVSRQLPGVVRVQCVQDLPRFDLPLLLGSFRSSSCNAVAVVYGEQSYLLAPAASVVYGSQIRVSLPGRDKPFPARVLHLGMECELAVLGLDSPEFWEAVVPYELAPYGLPHLQQQVTVVSYEDGQPRPRSAPATVMRTEVVTYPSAMQRLLGMTAAVALSKEHIGSAVVDSRGFLLGLIFARTAGSGGGKKAGSGGSGERWGQGRRRVGRRRGPRGQTEASASVVPVPVLGHFLEDVRRHSVYQGFPTLGIQWKRTESAALRRYTAMAPEQTGVLITSLNPTAVLAVHARPLDVLAAVGDAAVGNDGTVSFRGGADSIHISYHISQFQVGDQVELTLLRGGRQLIVPLVLGVPHRLLPLHLAGRPPQYVVVSGLVLTVLSAPFLEGAFGRNWAVRSPVQLLREWHNHPVRDDEQVVVVAECQDMGPGSATDGYERRAVMYQRVVRCNGAPVVNLRHLVTRLAEATAAAEAMATAEAGGAARPSGGRGGGGRRRGAAALRATGGAAAAAAPAGADTGASDVSEGDTAKAAPSSTLTDTFAVDEWEAGATRGSAAPSSCDAATAGPRPISTASESTDTGVGVGGDRCPPYDQENLVLELSNRMVLVLPLRRAREDTQAMLAEYEVQYAVSEDLRSVYDRGLRHGRMGSMVAVAGCGDMAAAAESGAVGRGGAAADGRSE